MAKELNRFEQTIKAYLDRRAAEDTLFAERYANPAKTISQCCNFIISEVRKTGRKAFADEEIYGMAVHFYDEANIGDIKPQNCHVVVPGEAPEKPAMEKTVTHETVTPAKKSPKKKVEIHDATPSLFDFRGYEQPLSRRGG